MANARVTGEDIKETAQAKVEDAKEAAQETVNDVKARFSNLTVNQKLVLTAVAAVAASIVVQRFAKRLRPERVLLVEKVDHVTTP